MARATIVLGLALAVLAGPARADSSSRTLAAYYDWHMAIVDGLVFEWRGDDRPRRLLLTGHQVGVGERTRYLLADDGTLHGWRHPNRAKALMTRVRRFAAGRSGVLAIRTDGSLWRLAGLAGKPVRIAAGVREAAVGDGADYYVTDKGELFVRGRAHRGQYGDGRLKATESFVRVGRAVVRVRAHTGHAVILKTGGGVEGTGGNIYGPLGRHGLGDKADRWGRIFIGAAAVATGSAHTVAIRNDGSLWAWGRGFGPDPVKVMTEVRAAAAGTRTTIALKYDGSLWQWRPGGQPRRLVPQ